MKAYEYLFVLLFFWGLSVLIGAFLWPYAINEWLVYAGKEPTCRWWHGAGLGAIPGFGPFCVPIAIVTWIAMLFL